MTENRRVAGGPSARLGELDHRDRGRASPPALATARTSDLGRRAEGAAQVANAGPPRPEFGATEQVPDASTVVLPRKALLQSRSGTVASGSVTLSRAGPS